MFVTKVEAAISVMQVENSIKKIQNKFFKEYKLPVPRIKIANSLTSRALGLCSYKGGDTNTTITIQKRITDDEKTLDRILTHELIHHWEFLILYAKVADSSIPLVKKAQENYPYYTRTSHGRPFLDWSKKINAVMGKDYVSETSDSTYIITLDKEYYILVAPSRAYSDRFGWCWAVRPSNKQWGNIKWLKEHCKAKLFKTRDDRYLVGERISNTKLSLPHLGTEEGKILAEYLKELYHSGKEVPVLGG